MKIDRHGRAKILSQAEIQLLFNQGPTTPRDRALFGICLYSACRIREACTLRTNDVYRRAGKVREEIIIRKGNTKGKLATRSIPVIEELRSLLVNSAAIHASPRWSLERKAVARMANVIRATAVRIQTASLGVTRARR